VGLDSERPASPDLNRAPTLLRARWVLQALPLFALWGICSVLPPERATRVGRWLLERLGPRSHKHRHVLRNLRVAFPEQTAEQIAGLARQVWGNLGSVLAEYPHLGRICRAEAAERLELEVEGEVSALRGGRPVVFVGAHTGNWELVPGVLTTWLGTPPAVVYGPQQNPLADRMVQHFRTALGYTLVAKDASMRQLVRELREGRSLGLVVDQRVDGSPLVPFFGVPAATAVSPARLALRFGCDLVPTRVERLPRTRFRVTVGPPVPSPDQGSDEDRALAMTRALNERFEAWIRERPGQWMCTKRRWSKREVRKARAEPTPPPPPAAPRPG
jgi:KDO2-lipid IV(A) lauroyltransferase